ncbi:Alpha/Beta hydrolase protein [Schizophyllum commune]
MHVVCIAICFLVPPALAQTYSACGNYCIAQVCGSTPPKQCVCTYSDKTDQLTTCLHANCADFATFSQAQDAYKAYCRTCISHPESYIRRATRGPRAWLERDNERLGAASKRSGKITASAITVLVYDHRGIGESSFANSAGDQVTIELMGRDLLELLASLRLTRLAICGFSMGGTIVQQLLLLPYHPSAPAELPFQVTHVVLAATMASTIISEGAQVLLQQRRARTEAEALEGMRRVVEVSFDSQWANDPANAEKVERWAKQFAKPRSKKAIVAQAKATMNINFDGLHSRLPRDVQFLVIHGTLDKIVPYTCSEEIMEKIPWARRVQTGRDPGEIEHLEFGHQWYGYFNVERWRQVFDVFLGSQEGQVKGRFARL